MNPNPLSDVISFLLQPGWTTVVYWLLAFASVAIAAYAWQTLPAQRSHIHIGNWASPIDGEMRVPFGLWSVCRARIAADRGRRFTPRHHAEPVAPRRE